jgi:DNA-binding NtrC family response regulator
MLMLPAAEPVLPADSRSLSPSPAIWLSGSSPVMTQLRGQIRRVAPYFRTALLTGERGCGEEAAAHVLHQLSPRAQQPFVELTTAGAEARCGTPNSAESLVGEGMLYLPRPEHLPGIAQTLLLRLLRERGSQAPRIVAFAERGLRPLVTTAGFSAALAESLGALRITLPSLRERHEDIPQLLTRILQEMAAQSTDDPPQLAPDLLEAAMKMPWPGNFAQLYSAAAELMQIAAKPLLHADDLKTVLGAIPQTEPHQHLDSRLIRLDDVIQEHIRAVLSACHGNKLRTAEALGISRSTLYRMLEAPAPPASVELSRHNLQSAG